ncbi:MAG: ABC transporter permease [Syntrophobacterales bacterium]|nr:ABC transporter permease [Syntrophobacterales bacterium]
MGFTLWWIRLWSLTVKELLQFSRDGFLIIAITYMFTLDIWLSGNIHIELHRASMIFKDADQSEFSRELISRFRSPYFRMEGEVFSENEAVSLLDRGEAILLIDIPEHFQQDLLSRRSVDVQLMIDGSNTIIGTLTSTYGSQIIGEYSLDIGLDLLRFHLDRLEAIPRVELRPRVWYNPNQEDERFLPISELLTVITICGLMLPAAAAVREKERGTIEQLLVSPLTPAQIMIPKVFSMTLVVLIGTMVSVFGVIKGIFVIPIKGSLIFFFSTVVLYTIAVSGMGLFISTFTKNLAQVAMLVLVVAMPVVLLSGAWTPPEAMPLWLRRAIHLSPLYYFIEMSYGILLRGAGFEVLWLHFLGLFLLGSGAFIFGAYRFRRQFG